METKEGLITYPSGKFEWRPNTKVFLGKLSELTENTLTGQCDLPLFSTLDADGDIFQGFAIKSDKTGNVTYWRYESDHRDTEAVQGSRVITGYVFVPHPYSIHQHPELQNACCCIMNDLI